MNRRDIITIYPNATITARMLNRKLPKGIRAYSVFNPGGIKIGGREILLVRFEDFAGFSGLVAIEIFGEGKDFEVIPGSIMPPEPGKIAYEDPRIVWLDGKCVITYVKVYQENEFVSYPCVSLMTTNDFSSYEQVGDAVFLQEEETMGRENKDACVLPRKLNLNGKKCFGLIHRPIRKGGPKMYLSFSEDGLNVWDNHKLLAAPRGGLWWDSVRIGLSAQPIEIPEQFSRGLPKGFLLGYHGVKGGVAGDIYRQGFMWFSTEELKITHRTRDWIFDDNIGFNCHGELHVIFLTAMWFDEDKEEVICRGGHQDAQIVKVGIKIKKLIKEELIPYRVI